MHRNIIKDTGIIPVDFTGLIYNDTGRMNYAAAFEGKGIRRANHQLRWFKSDMAAAKALDRIDGCKTTWTTRVWLREPEEAK